MSKAPHPKTPLRIVGPIGQAVADAAEAGRAEARRRYFSTDQGSDMTFDELLARAARERRMADFEDRRARRFIFRGPVAAIWAWLRGKP